MSEQESLLNDISMIDFAAVEMAEYLDTHPTDTEAIKYYNYYNNMKNKMSIEYAKKYSPLNLATAGYVDNYWNWATSPWPWEGGND